MQSGNQLRVAPGKLCADCQRLVDRLRQDDRITAVFIFSRGSETKYYAAFRNSAVVRVKRACMAAQKSSEQHG